ncbi:heavy metal translocating P-type ATPase [Kaistella sp. PBT33-4]|uniref:heavy metal translocating P-type ATPase n=1 Tax=Kaistella sp. PBT33-4 TaxID=3032000 RepID=UPI0023D81820|nr:heavy metal translocating P-type ATPase [Kaistella sp. PBT33-4]MDF0720041.1 heavy metal translocating P-type ATPase [Kaistella sp. PBT33-4]
MSKECCSIEEKPQENGPNTRPSPKDKSENKTEDGHDHDHSHDSGEKTTVQHFLPAIISLTLLSIGLLLQYVLKPDWLNEGLRLALYLASYIPVGFPVIKEAWHSIKHGDFFSEFFLMTIATIGAFAIGEYPEAVAVMLFYSVGEVFQAMAVQKAKLNIKSLLDQRPDEVTVIENKIPRLIKAQSAANGQMIQLKPGEKLALDGKLITESASFNTAALTGESKPRTYKSGDIVLAGMINVNTLSLVEVTTPYEDSKLSRILEMVQNATSQKAKTELFIRKFARVYTPIVVVLALSICLLPYFLIADYEFRDWLYRALVFLVISCPCALVISIPLGYFGGIGAGSRNGILFKGSNFLDVLAGIRHVVMDKTGTMTEGVFKVQEVYIREGFNKDEVLQRINTLESKSTHPIATAIREFVGPVIHTEVQNFEEIAGHGLRGILDGKEYLAGNFKLMDKFNIDHQIEHSSISDTLVAVAVTGKFAGYLTISDQIKKDAADAVKELKKLGVNITMLSGDKTAVVKEVADKIGITDADGDLLPEDKVTKVKALKSGQKSVAFVGDGVNDAPVVALSDVGIAMGGLGSDATVETADVVIQDDRPSRIPMAIRIGRETKKIVWQNIIMAFGVKAVVLILGAGGLASMWEAVFADVGVALLAILNAVRIQHKNFSSNK